MAKFNFFEFLTADKNFNFYIPGSRLMCGLSMTVP